MNAHKRVFLFVFGCLLLYVLFSYASFAYHIRWEPFDRVNLIADLLKKQEDQQRPISEELSDFSADSLAYNDGISPIDTVEKTRPAIPSEPKSRPDTQKITDQAVPRQTSSSSLIDPAIILQKGIIGFKQDNDSLAGAVLTHLADKLAEIKSGEKVKIRIAYFGDSMIEGDLLSQTLRSLMQSAYGGSGVGFIPITSQVAQFRQTAKESFSSGWKDLNFRTSRSVYHYLSGHTFLSSGEDWVTIRDNTTKDTANYLGKYLLYGPIPDSIEAGVMVGSKRMPLQGKAMFNRKLLSHDKQKSIKVLFPDSLLPIYGISFESDAGVIIDNFSFRGIAGLEYGRLSSQFMQQINTKNPYDLIIFQYGVNVMYKPEDYQFAWYRKAITPVVKKMKNCFPDADFLIVGAGDRAFRYPDGYQSAIGIEELLKEQAELALQTNSAFFSLYAAMGGKNSMVNWVNQTPGLANKDYVHPNAIGAKKLGRNLFDAIVADVNKRVSQTD